MEKDPILEFTKAAETQNKVKLKKLLEKQAAEKLVSSLTKESGFKNPLSTYWGHLSGSTAKAQQRRLSAMRKLLQETYEDYGKHKLPNGELPRERQATIDELEHAIKSEQEKFFSLVDSRDKTTGYTVIGAGTGLLGLGAGALAFGEKKGESLNKIAAGNLVSALAGGAIGAGAGALSDPQHRLRNAIIGGGVGAGAGLAINKIPSLKLKTYNPEDGKAVQESFRKSTEPLTKKINDQDLLEAQAWLRENPTPEYTSIENEIARLQESFPHTKEMPRAPEPQEQINSLFGKLNEIHGKRWEDTKNLLQQGKPIQGLKDAVDTITRATEEMLNRKK